MAKFIDYGLNKYRNFLSAPSRDDKLLLQNKNELIDFMCDALEDISADSCAIFADAYTGYYAAIKYYIYGETEEEAWEEGKLYGGGEKDSVCIDVLSLRRTEEDANEFFAYIDATCCLDCYGVIKETETGCFEIVED